MLARLTLRHIAFCRVLFTERLCSIDLKGILMSVSIIKTVKLQDKFFATIANNRRALETDMHRAAVSVLWHVGQHKDVRQIDKLMAALEDQDGATSILTNSLRAWFEAFGPVMFDGGKTVFLKDKGMQLAKATETPFWKFKPQPTYVAVDVLSVLSSLTKKLVKDAEMMNVDHGPTIAGIEALMTAERKRQEDMVLSKAQEANRPTAREPKSKPVPLLPLAQAEPANTAAI